MNVRQVTSLILLPAYLSACTGWQVQQVAPETLLSEEQPEQVQVRTTSHAEIVLDDPVVSGDTLYGTAPAGRMAIPMSGVESLAIKKTDAGKTVLLVLGVIVAVNLAAYAYHKATCDPSSLVLAC
jgi:hypothetical protein